jgi:hypothetical protein
MTEAEKRLWRGLRELRGPVGFAANTRSGRLSSISLSPQQNWRSSWMAGSMRCKGRKTMREVQKLALAGIA